MNYHELADNDAPYNYDELIETILSNRRTPYNYYCLVCHRRIVFWELKRKCCYAMEALMV